MYYWVDEVDLGSCLESTDNLWKSHVLEKPHFFIDKPNGSFFET